MSAMTEINSKVLATINEIEEHLDAILAIAEDAKTDPDFDGLSILDALGQLGNPSYLPGSNEPVPYVKMAHPFQQICERGRVLRQRGL